MKTDKQANKRVVKFRVIYKGEIFGYEYLTELGWRYSSEVSDFKIDSDGTIPSHWFENMNEVRRDQFTGLYDKNGAEIYENDIVTFQNHSSGHGKFGKKMKGVVGYDKYQLIIRNLEQNRWPRITVFDNQFTGCQSAREDEEIIGNIHMNPELLKS